MSVLGLLNSTCTIQRATETQDTNTGAVSYSWGTLTSGAFVGIQERSASESFRVGGEMGENSGVAYFPYGQDIKHTDRITSVAGPSSSLAGRTWECIGPPMDGAGRGVYTAVPIREVVQGPET